MEIGMNETSEAMDLLTLIGKAIGQLHRSIQHFEEADSGGGLSCLSTVITDIDTYLDRLADDPLVPLARVDPAKLRERLHHVQEDLTVVIEQVERPPAA
jgi:hypothetical protein